MIIILLLLIISLEAKEKQNILFLNSYHEVMSWSKDIKNGVNDVLAEDDSNYVFHIENMDSKRFSGANYYKTLSELYKIKYHDTKFDLILSSDNNALEFLKQYRNNIFGNVPVVFSGVNNYDENTLTGHLNYTGVSENISYEENIELILKLHPNVKNIYFINDYLKTGRLIEKNMHSVEQKYKNKVNIIYNENLSIEGLKDKINNLKKDTVILLGAYFTDENNEFITYEKAGKYILGKSSVPVYCIVQYNITNNIIGGHVVSSYSQGQLMAQLGKKILDGIPIQDLYVIKEDVNKYIFNLQGLNYYSINRDNLPNDSQIINDNITYLDQFNNMVNIQYIMISLILFIILIIFYKKIIFNEKGILNILVYGPIAFLPIIIGILIYNLVQYNDKVYKNDIKKLQKSYLIEQKKISFNEIEKAQKYITNIKSQMTLSLKNNLKDRVNEAYVIATNIYNINKNTKSEFEIKKMIIDALSKIRFYEGRGYYFINSNNGDGILFNGISKLQEKINLLSIRDMNGKFIIQDQINVVRTKGDGFTSHYFQKLNETKGSKKLSYIKMFEPYDWHIGTGEYIDDFDDNIKKNIYDYITKIRYGNNGYFFALSEEGTVLAHGDSKNLVGKNMFNKIDINGVHYTQEIIKNAIKNNLKFTEFNWLNKETQKIDTKYALGTYIEQYDLILGTGIFDNDIQKIILKETLKLNKKNNEQIEQLLKISFIVLVIVLFLSYFLSNMVKKIFQDYNNKLNNLNASLEKRIKKEIKISQEKDNLLFQQSKMASMGEMIGNIAHQWRQPLNVISVGATGLKIQKEHNILSDKFFMDTCDAINHNAQYLSQTIDDFKNFIKNDKEKIKFNLKDNIKSFLSLVHSSVKNNQINIKLDVVDNIIVNSYPNELTQCFMNLFNNAKDALKELSVERYLFISAKVEESKVIISFLDNAGGISDSVVDKIFEPYFTTKHKSQGTGLGLSMTYKIIVEGMDGTIDIHNTEYMIDNQKYKGSKFTITLDL